MNGLRLWKIADRVVTSFFISAEKNKDYKYIYDPDHKKNPGEGFEKTKSGWTKGKKKSKGVADEHTKENPIIVTKSQKDFVKLFYKKKKFYTGGFIFNLGAFHSVREEADKKYGYNIPDIEEKINSYSGPEYGTSTPAQKLSILACYAMGMEKGDYHTNWEKGPAPSPEELSNFKKYMKKEQEILKNAGLVTNNGKVRLFRNVGHSLFKYHEDGITYDNFQNHYGASFEYRGAHIESWTFKPDFAWDGAKIYAEVPLESVIASFVGRQGKSTSFQHQDESECMIVASMVKEVTLVGNNGNIIDSALNKYYSDISNDMGKSPEDYAIHVESQSKEIYEKFNKLVNSDNAKDKIEAILSPLCETDMVDKFAQDDNEDVRATAAKSSKLSLNVFKKMLDDKSEKVQSAIMTNPKIDYEDFEKLAKSPFDSVSKKAKKEIQKIIDKYVKLSKGSEKQKQEAAVSKYTPINILKELANDDSDYVKKYVADNPRTPSDILDELADKNEHIQKSVVENPNTTSETLKKITDKSITNYEKKYISNGWAIEKVLNSLSKNKNTPTESLDAIAKAGTLNVKISVAKNENVSPDTLNNLYDDCFPKNKESKNYALQDAIFSNKNMSADTIDKACKNSYVDANLKAKFIEYPNISINALKTISADLKQEKEVRTKASEKLKTMLKETSEAISEDEVTSKDIEFLRKYFPESCKGKSMDELVILFKTLAKRGYFSKGNGLSVTVDETSKPENKSEDKREEMLDEDKEIMDYLQKFM